MTSKQKGDLLLEASHPHLVTDEGQKFLRGQATTEKIQVCAVALSPRFGHPYAPLSPGGLSLHPFIFSPFSSGSTHPNSPANLSFFHAQSLLSQNSGAETAQRFNQLLLQFMWEEISPLQLQAELRNLFTANPCLRTPDLQADFDPVLALPANSDAERAAVKKALCDRLGLITQKREPGRPSLEEGIRFQKDVEVGGDADRELFLLFLLFICCNTSLKPLEMSRCFICRMIYADCVGSVGAF